MKLKHFGDAGAILVSAFLTMTQIQNLNVSYNDISADGAITIGNSLRESNTQLLKLVISHNMIGDEEIIAIIQSLILHYKYLTYHIISYLITEY